MGYYARRTDSNHCQVIETLEACGWYCLDTSRAGFGAPDVIAARGGHVWFVEIKDGAKSPSKRSLTPRELDVRKALIAAGCQWVSLQSVEDAVGLR